MMLYTAWDGDRISLTQRQEGILLALFAGWRWEHGHRSLVALGRRGLVVHEYVRLVSGASTKLPRLTDRGWHIASIVREEAIIAGKMVAQFAGELTG